MTAFAVVLAPNRDCPPTRLSVTLKFGHLYGLRHEDDDRTPYVFGHGFAQKAVRDVMATDKSCDSCPRLGLFSNPALLHGGKPLGAPACCDNARVVREHTSKILPRFKCRA